jgi:dynein light intermediate chain 1, cytosolic
METVANAWSAEIQSPPEAEFNPSTTKPAASKDTKTTTEGETNKPGEETSVSIFTSSLPDPIAGSKPYIPSTVDNDAVTVQDPQTFLAEQAQILESLKAEDERAERRARKGAPPPTVAGSFSAYDSDDAAGRERLTDQTVPYKLNVGGIQVDAEEAMRRIRLRAEERERDLSGNRTPRKEAGASGSGSGVATPDGGKMPNEALASYFAGLMKKAKGSSESPRAGSGSGSAAER